MNKGMATIRASKGMAAKIAKNLKISRGAVSRWQHVPAERVVEVERITGIAREELRPDIFRVRHGKAG